MSDLKILAWIVNFACHCFASRLKFCLFFVQQTLQREASAEPSKRSVSRVMSSAESRGLDLQRAYDRLNAIKRMLDGVRSTPHFFRHALAQAKCLKPILESLTPDASQLADLTRHISQVGFPPEVEVQVVGYCSPGIDKKNVALQDYSSFLDYFTNSQWQDVDNNSASGNFVLMFIMRHLLKMGLRHPSCQTFRLMTALYCMIYYGREPTCEMGKTRKYKEVKAVKKQFHNLAARYGEPPLYVRTLPAQASTFLENFDCFAEIFEKELPVKCVHDADVVSCLADSFPLRMPRNGFADEACAQLVPKSIQPAASDLQSFSLSLMKDFMQMMKSQLHQNNQDEDEDDLLTNFVDHRGRKTQKIKQAIKDGPPKVNVDPRADFQVVSKDGATAAPSKTTSKKKKRKRKAATDGSDGATGAPSKAVVVWSGGATGAPSKAVVAWSGGATGAASKAVVAGSDGATGAKKKKKRKRTAEARAVQKSLLDKLLDREEEKKKQKKLLAEKKKDAALAAKAEKAKKAAALAGKAEKGKKTADAAPCEAPPLGCSKCRYLVNGCTECRNKREAFLAMQASKGKKSKKIKKVKKPKK